MNEFTAIKTLEDYQNAIQNKAILLFTTTWCPDCHFIKPFIGDVAKANPEFNYFVVDRDEMIDLCKDLDILGIPSFVAYNEGKEIGRFVSKLRKTRNEIEEFINSMK